VSLRLYENRLFYTEAAFFLCSVYGVPEGGGVGRKALREPETEMMCGWLDLPDFMY